VAQCSHRHSWTSKQALTSWLKQRRRHGMWGAPSASRLAATYGQYALIGDSSCASGFRKPLGNENHGFAVHHRPVHSRMTSNSRYPRGTAHRPASRWSLEDWPSTRARQARCAVDRRARRHHSQRHISSARMAETTSGRSRPYRRRSGRASEDRRAG